MADRFKIAYIGAGSFRFSTGLFLDVCQKRESPNDISPMEIGLCDIDENSLHIMKKMFKNIVDKAKRINGVDILITTSTNREDVLENADVVFKSISVGIQEAECFDIHLPFKLGIPQNTGDTVGPGGLFRGLRTNPVVADIARDMKRLSAKNSMLLNYTNPQATIVLAAHTAAPDVQFLGLCHEIFGGMKNIHGFFNEKMGYNVPSWKDYNIEYAGVNHFAWITKLEYKGEDMYPKLRENAHSLFMKNYKNRGYNYYLLEKYGWFPYPGSRHIAEFLPDYYNFFNHRIQSSHWRFPKLRNVRMLGAGRKAAYFVFKLIGNGIIVPKPRTSGENAVEMTTAWRNNEPTPFVVNLPNNGTVPQLPDDCVVEIPAVFKNNKITPVSTINLDSKVAGLLRPHAEQHRLTVDAALGNDMDLVIKAMQHDPMNQWIEDPDRIEYLTKMMLYYQQRWLPEEWKEWIPKKEELEKSKWWISPTELQKFGRKYKQKKFFLTENLREKAYFDK